MEIHELVIEMKLLERRMTLYEEKYGVLSEDFYAALIGGKLANYDAYDETRADFSRWKGIYETLRKGARTPTASAWKAKNWRRCYASSPLTNGDESTHVSERL